MNKEIYILSLKIFKGHFHTSELKLPLVNANLSRGSTALDYCSVLINSKGILYIIFYFTLYIHPENPTLWTVEKYVVLKYVIF